MKIKIKMWIIDKLLKNKIVETQVNENGEPLFSAEKVYNVYSSDGSTNYKWTIWGDLEARPDELERKPIPVASLFIEWNTTDIYVMTSSGWKLFE